MDSIQIRQRYSNEAERANLDTYDDIKLKKNTFQSPLFIQKYFNVVMAKPALTQRLLYAGVL